MKKLVILLGLFAFCINPAFAFCDYMEQCPSQPYPVSSPAVQMFSKMTGSTFIAEKVAENIIRGELRKIVNQDLDVDLKTFSAQDLAQGKFQSLKVSGQNLNVQGVYLSSLKVQTLCDYNYVDYKAKPIKLVENMALGASVVISDDDLRKTLQSGSYLDMVNKIDLTAFGVSFFKVDGTSINIKDNKLYFTVKVISPILMRRTPVDVVVSADIRVQNGRIVYSRIDFVNLYMGLDFSQIMGLLNYVDPLKFSIQILEGTDAKFNIKDVSISGDKITINGNIFVPRSCR